MRSIANGQLIEIVDNKFHQNMDKIRNEYIRGIAQVGRFGEKTRQARLMWFGHVRRKGDGYFRRRVLRMELPGKRKRGKA